MQIYRSTNHTAPIESCDQTSASSPSSSGNSAFCLLLLLWCTLHSANWYHNTWSLWKLCWWVGAIPTKPAVRSFAATPPYCSRDQSDNSWNKQLVYGKLLLTFLEDLNCQEIVLSWRIDLSPITAAHHGHIRDASADNHTRTSSPTPTVSGMCDESLPVYALDISVG